MCLCPSLHRRETDAARDAVLFCACVWRRRGHPKMGLYSQGVYPCILPRGIVRPLRDVLSLLLFINRDASVAPCRLSCQTRLPGTIGLSSCAPWSCFLSWRRTWARRRVCVAARRGPGPCLPGDRSILYLAVESGTTAPWRGPGTGCSCRSWVGADLPGASTQGPDS